VLIEIAHTNPYGPLGFACVLVAATLLVPWRAKVLTAAPVSSAA
jgi:hypothetical protein